MQIVDAQVHLNMVGIEAGLAAMDAVGVDAVLIDEFWEFEPGSARPRPTIAVPGGSFRHIAPTAELAVAQHPGRFGYLTRYQPDDPDLDYLIRTLRDRPGRLALRVSPLTPDRGRQLNRQAAADLCAAIRAGVHDRFFALAERHAVPIFLQVNGNDIPGDLDLVHDLAGQYPDLVLIVDHTGLSLPARHGAAPPDALDRLPDVIALARHPNVALKWGHAPRLSAHEFPYPDVREALYRVVEAFGAMRVTWASDWTLDVPWVSYADSLYYILGDEQLSPDERAAVLGGSTRSILRWEPEGRHGQA